MDTPASLLERLRRPGEEEAWGRFVALYTPLLFFWARRLGCQDADAADLVQDTLLVLSQKLPEFLYDRQRSFRGWLRTVLLNKWRQQQRRPALPLASDDAGLATLAAPDDGNGLSETEYRQQLVGRALRIMQAEFSPSSWKACWETIVAGRPTATVAAELGMSAAAVRVARSRVLHRLRQELRGLLE
jgi:RNA polymerase sigma-70 factor (ECF subfamily)